MQPEQQRHNPCRRACLPSKGEVLAHSAFDSCTEATLLLELLPEKPYLVVPTTLKPGAEASFEMRCAPVPGACAEQSIEEQPPLVCCKLACAGSAIQRHSAQFARVTSVLLCQPPMTSAVLCHTPASSQVGFPDKHLIVAADCSARQ